MEPPISRINDQLRVPRRTSGAVGNPDQVRPASGPPTCCILPPMLRAPRSMGEKPAASNRATTSDFASVSSPKKYDSVAAGLMRIGGETAATSVFAAFTTARRLNEISDDFA